MQIGARDLQPIMDTLLSKLHTLLQPLYEGGQPPVTPSLGEVRAATELMVWMTSLMTRLQGVSERNAELLGELTIEEMTIRRNQWPNVNAWETFISGVKGLTLPEVKEGVEREAVCPKSDSGQTLSRDDSLASVCPKSDSGQAVSHDDSLALKEVVGKHTLDEEREIVCPKSDSGQTLSHDDSLVLKEVVSKDTLDEERAAVCPKSDSGHTLSHDEKPVEDEVGRKHPIDEYREAVDGLYEAQQMMLKVAKEMKKKAPGVGDKARAGKVMFLPTDSQRYVYKEYVLTYYNRYIRGRELQHQELMVHYAVVYHAIALRTGINQRDFYGPDYDDFMYSYCGIKYNRSSQKRGRYRQVCDVRYACVPALWKDGDTPTMDSRLKELFYAQLSCFNDIIGASATGRMSRSRVPQKLW